MDKNPIYPYPASYAREHGELEQFRESRRALVGCKNVIDIAIRKSWDGMNLAPDAAKEVLAEYGPERVAYVLAATVQQHENDLRFSRQNRDWAKTIPLYLPEDQRPGCILESHPVKADLFIDLARKDMAELARQKAQAKGKQTAQRKKASIKMDKTPLYSQPYDYAYQHGEAEQHMVSHRANIACKAAIEKAIDTHYHDSCLDTVAAVRDVAEQFGFDRMLYVLANTVQTMDSDGRVSRANKEWARTVPVAFENGKRDVSYLITRSHPGLLNMFVADARHEHLLRQPLKAADIREEASRILKRFQEAQEPNSPSGTHYMVQISDDFMTRAKTKDQDRLMAILPFQSLAFSTLDSRKGVFALISKDEDRFQPLVLRRPSVQKKLQENAAAASAPAAPGKSKSRGQER